MNKRGLSLEAGIVIAIVFVILILMTFVGYAVFQDVSTEGEEGAVIIEDGTVGGGVDIPLCNDGLDNDGDGDIDLEDYGCQNQNDDSEVNNGNTECNDGLDNDGDGDIDQRDSNCVDPSDDTEGVITGGGDDGNETSESLDVDLVSPENEEYVSDDPVIFTYIPSNVSLDVCELWGDFDGTFMMNQSDTSPDEDQENTFSLSLNDGEYKWGIYCSAIGGDEIFTSNRTLFVDSVAPNLVLNEPLNNTYAESSIQFNYTVGDASPIDCSISYSGATSGDVTQDSCDGETIYNLTGLVEGSYFMEIAATDSAGNSNSTNVSLSVELPCGFDSASWNTTIAEEGEIVLASVDGSGCENSDLVNYDIYRVYTAGSDILVVEIDGVAFINSTSSTTWTVVATGSQEEYYFNATLSTDASISLESGLLNITPPDFSPASPVERSVSGKGWILALLVLGLVIFIAIVVTSAVRNIRRARSYE